MKAVVSQLLDRFGGVGVLLIVGSLIAVAVGAGGVLRHRELTNPSELPSGPAVLSPDELVNEVVYEFFVAASACLTQVDVFEVEHAAGLGPSARGVASACEQVAQSWEDLKLASEGNLVREAPSYPGEDFQVQLGDVLVFPDGMEMVAPVEGTLVEVLELALGFPAEMADQVSVVRDGDVVFGGSGSEHVDQERAVFEVLEGDLLVLPFGGRVPADMSGTLAEVADVMFGGDEGVVDQIAVVRDGTVVLDGPGLTVPDPETGKRIVEELTDEL